MHVVNIVVSPSYSKTNWFRDFQHGADDAGSFGNTDIRILECDDNIEEICSKCDETSGIAVVISSSAAWESKVLKHLDDNGVHPVIIRPSSDGEMVPCSRVSIDYYGKTLEIMKYFFESGFTKIAYLAHNRDSSQDNRKYSAFREAFSYAGMSFSEEDVYENTGSVDDCVQKLKDRIDEYDAVLCANDVVAVSLVSEIGWQSRRIPILASFGDTRLLKIIHPGIISVSLNFRKAGEAAVRLCLYLSENKAISSAEYIVASGVAIPNPLPKVRDVDFLVKTEFSKGIHFYDDKTVVDIFRTENALSLCDELDIEILCRLLEGRTYEQIAEDTNTAVTTVKYRLKKIYSYFGIDSRKQLLDMFEKFMQRRNFNETD